MNDFQLSAQAIIAKLQPEHQTDLQKNIEQLLSLGVSSWDDLTQLATDKTLDEPLQTTISWLLGKWGNPHATPTLIQMLDSDSVAVRAETALSLGYLEAQSAIDTLMALLDSDESMIVRICAANAIGMIGDQNAGDRLIAKLNDTSEHENVRGQVAEALGMIGDRQALPALISNLQNPSAEIRYWVIFALELIGDPAVIPLLEPLLTDDALANGQHTVAQQAKETIAALISGDC